MFFSKKILKLKISWKKDFCNWVIVYFCTFVLVPNANAIVFGPKTTIAAVIERSTKLLNSGTVKVGEAEEVEVVEIARVGLWTFFTVKIDVGVLPKESMI